MHFERVGHINATALELKLKEASNFPVIVHSHVQIDARRQQAGVPSCYFYLGQRPPPCEGMRYKSMPPVMNRERPQPRQP